MLDTATAPATTRISCTASVFGQNLKRITALLSAQFSAERSSQFRIHREDVPASPYGFNIARILRVRLDFLAQPADMVIDRAVEQVGIAALGQIQKLIAGESYFRALQQSRQQAEFPRRKRHGDAIRPDQFALAGVQHPI